MSINALTFWTSFTPGSVLNFELMSTPDIMGWDMDLMPDLNCFTLKSAMSMVAGTARSMGIKVEGPMPEDI